jgi:hypothetical protein
VGLSGQSAIFKKKFSIAFSSYPNGPTAQMEGHVEGKYGLHMSMNPKKGGSLILIFEKSKLVFSPSNFHMTLD